MILAAMSDAIDFLLRAQNADGGWGYRVGRMTYVEPTAAAMLALKNRDENARHRARELLLRGQRADGGWGIAALDDESGWMTAWAVRALADFKMNQIAIDKGALWLFKTSGITLTEPKARAKIREWYRMDSALRGWPWQVGDAAWVHPTALALLALAAAGYREHARFAEGVAYLRDRALDAGGWNIGNPQMLDKPLPATIQDTAIALLALRAGDATKPDAAITYLQNTLARAQTAAELAWGIYALDAWSVRLSDARARLRASQKSDGSWEGNPFTTAIATLTIGNLI